MFKALAEEQARRWPTLLDDMADDAVGLLDALGIERAPIVGASLGGMVAQLVAADHPDRTLSLTSIMSTTGNRDPAAGLARGPGGAERPRARPDGVDFEGYLAHAVKGALVVGGSPAPGPGGPGAKLRIRNDFNRSYSARPASSGSTRRGRELARPAAQAGDHQGARPW